MGGQASRPIIVTVTDTGVVYVPLARERGYISVQIEAGGLTGIAVDYTGQNIVRDNASSYDVQSRLAVDRTDNAIWTAVSPNAISTPIFGQNIQAFALRLTGAGTGTATVTILQDA